MEKLEVKLIPLQPDDRERFIKDNQEAFRYGAMEEFGMRDDHYEEDGEIISRQTIINSIDGEKAEAYRIFCDGEKVATPLMRTALDILKKYDFKFSLLRNLWG